MKNLILFLSFFPLLNGTAQNFQLTGAWTCGPAEGQSYEQATSYFTADGHYYLVLDYGQNDWDGNPIVEEGMGVYEVDGDLLKVYDLKNDGEHTYRLQNTGDGRMDVSNSTGSWDYHYQGNLGMPAIKRAELRSWENYRKLDGNWRSDKMTLKFISSQGILIIRSNTDTEFFNWGHYSIDGNRITLKEISGEETEFYHGQLSDFSSGNFVVTDEVSGEAEHYSYQSPLNLDETEMIMVTKYMNMMHRLNMDIIGAIGGNRYIWKWVDQYGNEVD